MTDRRGFLGALLAAPVFAGLPHKTSMESIGGNREWFLEHVNQLLLRGDEYEAEYNAKLKKHGIPVANGLTEACTMTGDANWQYTFTAKRRR